jgi:hypothetical protein
MPNNVNHDSMLQEAITTIQDAFFDPQKFDFMDMFSAASKQSRLAYFISDKDVLFAIEQDLSNFRTALQKQGVRGGDEMDDEMGSSSDKALLSLKSAIERLHLTLKKDVNAPDRISQAMIEEAIMDLAAAVEQGNDDEREVNGFIASHSSVIASVLKSSIAVLYEELLDGDMEDVQVLDFTAISFHFANNPTKAMTIMPGTTAGSTNKEYTVMGECLFSNATEAAGGGLYADFESKMIGALEDDEVTMCYLSKIVEAVVVIIFPPLLLLVVRLCTAFLPLPEYTAKECLDQALNAYFNPKCWIEACDS